MQIFDQEYKNFVLIDILIFRSNKYLRWGSAFISPDTARVYTLIFSLIFDLIIAYHVGGGGATSLVFVVSRICRLSVDGRLVDSIDGYLRMQLLSHII